MLWVLCESVSLGKIIDHLFEGLYRNCAVLTRDSFLLAQVLIEMLAASRFFIYLLKACSPVNRTGSPEGLCCLKVQYDVNR